MSIELLGQVTLTAKQIRSKISIIRKLLLVLQQLQLLMFSNLPTVVCHWTATDLKKTHWQSIENDHRRRGYPRSKRGHFMAYNVIFEEDGTKFMARDYYEQGEATGTFSQWSNKFHLDIAVTGTTGQNLSEEQIKAINKELKVIEKMYGGYILEPHSKYYATVCPGQSFKNHYQLK